MFGSVSRLLRMVFRRRKISVHQKHPFQFSDHCFKFAVLGLEVYRIQTDPVLQTAIVLASVFFVQLTNSSADCSLYGQYAVKLIDSSLERSAHMTFNAVDITAMVTQRGCLHLPFELLIHLLLFYTGSAIGISGRFVEKNNGNAGEPSRNWCLRPCTWGASARLREYFLHKKIEIVYAKILQSSAFLPENGSKYRP